MTILVGLISERGGVVASDGRRVDSCGKVKSDCFRKVFRIDGLPAVFAVAGQLAFSGKETSEHVREILVCSCPANLADATESLKGELAQRLAAIPENECARSNRRVDVILLAPSQLTRGPIEGRLLCFHPNECDGSISCKVCNAGPGDYLRAGDDEAQEAVLRKIKKGANVRGYSVPDLRKYAEQLVRTGTDACGPHSFFPDLDSCAGGPFSETIDAPEPPSS